MSERRHYRHKVTGLVGSYPTTLAAVTPELEEVDADDLGCVDCTPDETPAPIEPVVPVVIPTTSATADQKAN